MTRKLKDWAQDDRDEFDAEDGCCSCHLHPPCGYCVHPGNPRNQEDDEFYEDDEGIVEKKESLVDVMDVTRRMFR